MILAVRDPRRGADAAATMGGEVEVRRLDLADLASVRLVAGGFEDPLDLLIDNAGLMIPPLGRTADGFELQFGTKHLGHFALTTLLLAQIVGRVVTVSSIAHRSGAINPTTPTASDAPTGRRAPTPSPSSRTSCSPPSCSGASREPAPRCSPWPRTPASQPSRWCAPGVDPG